MDIVDAREQSIRNALTRAVAKSRAALAQAQAKRRKSTPARELLTEWNSASEQYLPGVPTVGWSVAEAQLAKKLIEEHGFDGALGMTRHFMATWSARRQSKDGQPPSMKLCWAMRARLIAEISGGATTPKSKGDRISADEFNEIGDGDGNGDLGW
jgi:hypothetical protein